VTIQLAPSMAPARAATAPPAVAARQAVPPPTWVSGKEPEVPQSSEAEFHEPEAERECPCAGIPMPPMPPVLEANEPQQPEQQDEAQKEPGSSEEPTEQRPPLLERQTSVLFPMAGAMGGALLAVAAGPEIPVGASQRSTTGGGRVVSGKTVERIVTTTDYTPSMGDADGVNNWVTVLARKRRRAAREPSADEAQLIAPPNPDAATPSAGAEEPEEVYRPDAEESPTDD